MRSRSLAHRLVTVVALVAFACTQDDEPACYPGDQLACDCPGETGKASGFRACDAARRIFGACLCDGTTPGVDAGGATVPDGGVDAGPAATKRGFLEACTTDTDCESKLCFTFAAKGARCTRACKPETAATDCPPPSTGCNNQGVCKAP